MDMIPLREHLETRIDELDRRLSIAIQANERTAATALVYSKEATEKASAAMEKRLDGMNEFRQTLTDQAKTYITKPGLWGAISGAMMVMLFLFAVWNQLKH